MWLWSVFMSLRVSLSSQTRTSVFMTCIWSGLQGLFFIVVLKSILRTMPTWRSLGVENAFLSGEQREFSLNFSPPDDDCHLLKSSRRPKYRTPLSAFPLPRRQRWSWWAAGTPACAPCGRSSGRCRSRCRAWTPRREVTTSCPWFWESTQNHKGSQTVI